PAADPPAGVVVVEAVADVEVPLGAVDLLAVELVAPDQLPARRGRLGRLVYANGGDPGAQRHDHGGQTPASDSRHPVLLVPIGLRPSHGPVELSFYRGRRAGPSGGFWVVDAGAGVVR